MWLVCTQVNPDRYNQRSEGYSKSQWLGFFDKYEIFLLLWLTEPIIFFKSASFSNVKLLSAHFHIALFVRKSLCKNQIQGMGSYYSYPSGQNIYINCWEFFCVGKYLNTHQLHNLFWYHEIYFNHYGMETYVKLRISQLLISTLLFSHSNCSAFISWKSIQLALISL